MQMDMDFLFKPKNFRKKIPEFIGNYDYYYQNLKSFPYVSTKMCEDYLDVLMKY